MAEKIESLQDIKSASKTAEVKVRKANRDKQGRSYATGKRKDAGCPRLGYAGQGQCYH